MQIFNHIILDILPVTIYIWRTLKSLNWTYFVLFFVAGVHAPAAYLLIMKALVL